jgi:phospholipase C
MQLRKLLAPVAGALAVVAIIGGKASATSTPIQHVVVIFQENVSFDHYFATYPAAKNSDGGAFTAVPGTPTVNGLTGGLLAHNPNFNGTIGAPFRLTHAQAATCDQNHDYTAEQQAFDLGLMDLFPSDVNIGSCGTIGGYDGSVGHPKDLVMGYYDGNTVTALWNYAQNFAVNDNSYSTTFGPSTPGAINLISGNTSGAVQDVAPSSGVDITAGSMTSDAQPVNDTCTTRDSAHMTGKNIGDLLNAANVTWGWFEAGFNLTTTNPNGTTGCARTHSSETGAFSPKVDYIPHHEPFQYYASTANPKHARPAGTIGTTDAANHQYDSQDFFDALAAGNLPSVVFLKAAGYQDGHAGYSSPLDEQTFVVGAINKLEGSKFWNSTAVIIAYDDSDGWYDHAMSPIIMHSQQSTDALTGSGQCGSTSTGLQGQGRCGFGPRQPLLVISPWAKTNFVDHTLTDLSSITAFVENNWGLGRIGGTQTSGGSFVGSTDQFAGTISNMFDFNQKKGHLNTHKTVLDPTTGEVTKSRKDIGDQS